MKRLASIRGVVPISALALCLWSAALAPSGSAQAGADSSPRGAAIVASSGGVALNLARSDPSDFMREIDDPSLGRRWLLYRDPRHPEGPGRLVAVSESAPIRAKAASSLSRVSFSALPPLIRAGDRVVLEEHSPVVDARLEAIALVSATQGSPLKVRLVLGGKVVQGVAIARGRVALAPQPERLQ